MSKISDEIRNWCEFEDGTECGGFVTKASFNKILALADRIDAEMVELPKDADGVPIHVRDTVWTVKNGGVALKVTSITLYGDVVAVDGVCEGCHAHVVPSDLTHVRPDSWERIADELDAWTTRAAEKCGEFGVEEDALHGFANRIRKLAAKGDE